MKLGERLHGARGLEWMLLCVCAALALLLLLRGEGESVAVSPAEERLQAVLSQVAGAGDVRVFVHGEDGAETGVLIVAQGAGNLRVAMELRQAAHSALGVELNRIEVLKMEED